MSSGVGHVFPIFIEGYRRHRADFVLSLFNTKPYLDGPEFKSVLYGAPPVSPRDVSSASSSRCPRVVGGSQGGNLGESAILNDGALRAPSSRRVDAGNVKEEGACCLLVCGSVVCRVKSRFIQCAYNCWCAWSTS